ncbi:MAG TPA: hypothetical protein V6D08_05650 [Candidatus Obscuribacterales bacterium]
MTTVVEDVGQIQLIELADGFVEGAHLDNVVGDSSLRRFHLKDDPETRICFFYRGYGVNEPTAEAFSNVLESPDHVLAPVELAVLGDLIGEKANHEVFSIAGARTEQVADRRVLIVEGTYKATGERNCTVYINADGTGKFVQEIFFQAPADRYLPNFPLFSESLMSVEWK